MESEGCLEIANAEYALTGQFDRHPKQCVFLWYCKMVVTSIGAILGVQVVFIQGPKTIFPLSWRSGNQPRADRLLTVKEDVLQQDLDNIALGILLGVDLVALEGVLDQLLAGSELSDLLLGAAGVHQVNEVDVDLLECLKSSLSTIKASGT